MNFSAILSSDSYLSENLAKTALQLWRAVNIRNQNYPAGRSQYICPFRPLRTVLKYRNYINIHQQKYQEQVYGFFKINQLYFQSASRNLFLASATCLMWLATVVQQPPTADAPAFMYSKAYAPKARPFPALVHVLVSGSYFSPLLG